MLELAVEFVAVTIEVVLQALEQIRREVGAVAGRIAVGADGIEPLDHERTHPARLTAAHESAQDNAELAAELAEEEAELADEETGVNVGHHDRY
jgi:hypothetical protein